MIRFGTVLRGDTALREGIVLRGGIALRRGTVLSCDTVLEGGSRLMATSHRETALKSKGWAALC